MNWERFWWNNVHGPRSVIAALAECALGRKNVFLTCSGRLSWQDYLRELSKELIEQTGAASVRYVDAARDLDTGEHPGDFLIRRFTSGEGYRPHAERWWEYLRRSGTLDGVVLWIYGTEQTDWSEPCRRLKGVCTFVIETEYPRTPGFEVVDAALPVTRYDYLLLASQAASERDGIPDAWRPYLADLAVEGYSGDAEGIVGFIERFDPRCAPEAHDPAIPPGAVWKAQLRNGYHLIEEARLAWIRTYAAEIAKCLPEIQFNEEVSDPFEVELGLLWHLTTPRRTELGKRRLVLPHDDFERLRFLHNVRNKLAHGTPLQPWELELLLPGQAQGTL